MKHPVKRRNLLFPAAVTVLLLFATGVPAQTRFQPIDIDFPHVWDKSEHPFTGAAVIDIDGDGIWEVFIGGGKGQPDGLFRFEAGELKNVIEGSGLRDPLIFCFRIDAQLIEHTYRSQFLTMLASVDVGV